MYWSVPFSATDGPTTGPNLQSQYSYDFNTGFLNSQTDPNGLMISYMPDAAVRVKKVTYPKLASDTNANPTLETFFANDQNGPSSADTLVYQSKFTYSDGATQRVQISNQWLDGGGRTIRAGSAVGPAITSFDAVKSIYDDLGRVRKSTNPYNTTNSDGSTTGLPNATVYAYDSLGRVLTVTLPDANTVTTSYNGALTTVTDQVGRQKRSEADGLGRTIKVTEMDNSKQLNWNTAYGYDLNDNLISVDQGGQTRAFKYDPLSRMTYERTPEQDAPIAVTENNLTTNWSAHYTYTSFNAIATREDARRVISTYSYDGLNRLYQVGYTLPSPNPDNVQATATVNITYGAVAPKNGQVDEVKQSFSQSDVPWKESYVYDGLSRLSSKTVSFDSQAYSYTTGYAYNQAGQLTQMTYPSTKVVKYGFDNRGRLNTVGEGSIADKYVSSVGYQPSQQVSSISLKNGVTENYGYSADRLQLTSQTATKGGNTLMSLTYNYVADKSRSGGVGSGQANTGQLMDITSSQINAQQRNESYNYDQVARLTQASGFYSQRTYTYDRWGNRTAVSGGASQSVMLQQPGGGVTNNRIASVNSGPSYQYDAAGDVTYDAVHSFSYDAESRIVKVDSGSTGTYSYDSANRRVKKVAAGHTTHYVWEGSKVIAEYGDAPAGAGGTRFYHPDRLSNRMITDGSGVVKGAMDNLPFGEDAGVVGETEKHRFTTYERDDESGTDYAVNRQYSQSTGRFMRPDAIPGSVGNPQSSNRYAYVQNDPINFVDPLGLVRVCQPSLKNPGCLVCTEDNGSLTVDCRPRDFLIPITRPRPTPPPDRPERPEKPEHPQPPVACPLDPRSWRPPAGEYPWSRMNPPETLSPRVPQGPELPKPPVGNPVTGTPSNPGGSPRVSPTDPMIPRDPSIGWKVRFALGQAGRLFGAVFNAAVRGAGEGFGVVVVNPCIVDRRYCGCGRVSENTVY
ncbi:MAG: RHS repeat-associated core domain-containing protein [Acidobacteriota bacterium]